MKGRVLAIHTEPQVSDEQLIVIADAFYRSDGSLPPLGSGSNSLVPLSLE